MSQVPSDQNQFVFVWRKACLPVIPIQSLCEVIRKTSNMNPGEDHCPVNLQFC